MSREEAEGGETVVRVQKEERKRVRFGGRERSWDGRRRRTDGVGARGGKERVNRDGSSDR